LVTAFFHHHKERRFVITAYILNGYDTKLTLNNHILYEFNRHKNDLT